MLCFTTALCTAGVHSEESPHRQFHIFRNVFPAIPAPRPCLQLCTSIQTAWVTNLHGLQICRKRPYTLLCPLSGKPTQANFKGLGSLGFGAGQLCQALAEGHELLGLEQCLLFCQPFYLALLVLFLPQSLSFLLT